MAHLLTLLEAPGARRAKGARTISDARGSHDARGTPPIENRPSDGQLKMMRLQAMILEYLGKKILKKQASILKIYAYAGAV